MVEALLCLGSNMEPEQNLPAALAALGRRPELQLLRVSPIYWTAPIGGRPGMAPFHNAAAAVETVLSPHELRQVLRAIEEGLGRVRSADKYAPRPVDLDIACYGDQVLDCDGRRIPDPEIVHFPHLAVPLADLAPEWVHPDTGLCLRQLASHLSYTDKDIRRL